MSKLTKRERISNILNHQPVDRIGVYEHFWGYTKRKWNREGFIGKNENIADCFDLDIAQCGPFDTNAYINFVDEIIEETEDTILIRDGNGALLRKHKKHASTPEHVDFKVKKRKDWEEYIKPLLTPDLKRINFEKYRNDRNCAIEKDRFFLCSGPHVFEKIQRLCGHENMLIGMALDPDWIKDMVSTYSNLIVELMEILFSREGCPDGIWFNEDMGFKQKPFMSPAMYDEIIKPGHKCTIDFAKANNLPVIMHSCGYIEPLLPGMIDAGIDCLQAMEVKAGMDLIKIYKEFGKHISLMGGIDVRVLCANNRKMIDEELERKIPVVKEGYGYILHSDHSIPDTVNYETYEYFIQKGIELGTY